MRRPPAASPWDRRAAEAPTSAAMRSEPEPNGATDGVGSHRTG
jgi:hypothetical protein